MEITIFYSWQSDAQNSICRRFIRGALDSAIGVTSTELNPYEPIRLESDTGGESGTPDVPNTILSRIRDAAVFVGDLTLVGVAGEQKKKTPNSNVLVEYGYAVASIGWKRVIAVMNEAETFGKFDEQIFHLKHRRKPICYCLEEGVVPSDRKQIEKKLSSDLTRAIQACLSESHLKAERILRRLDFRSFDFLRNFGKAAYFHLGDHEAILQTQLIRLLDLELLRFDYSAEAQKYAYHWTYYGRLVLQRLRIVE